jgi:hypothetical protein
MANISRGPSPGKDQEARNTGHGSLGMGGQPVDDPRDIAGGGEGRTYDDRGGGTGPIPGAFGSGPDVAMAGGSAGNETVGPMGDKGITGDFGVAESDRSRKPDRGQLKGGLEGTPRRSPPE